MDHGARPPDSVRPPAAVDRPVVAVYRSLLLWTTETYIRSQAEAMGRYQSQYVGLERVAGLDLPEDRVIVLNRGGRLGRARQAVFEWFGVSPSLVAALRGLRPVLVHAHLGSDGAMALPLARRLRLPLVVTFHGFDATASDEAVRRRGRRYQAFLRRRDAMKREGRLFIAVSEFIRGKLLERGWPEERVVVHYIGVDTERFRADPGVPREPVVLFVGRLIETKGVTHLIAAMREVQTGVPEAELVVVGGGPLRGDLERQARESGVRARFLREIAPADVRAWMNRARVVCMPSVTASDSTVEAMPIVALEAQAMGVPVVGSRSGGIPEAVVDGETGLLGPEGDRAALAAHLEALLTDAALWQRLSTAAVARVRERFDLHRQTARLEDLYDSVRAQPAGARRPGFTSAVLAPHGEQG
jgi:colanic acid/amylovoran biosynthesis glycosyltransferase